MLSSPGSLFQPLRPLPRRTRPARSPAASPTRKAWPCPASPSRYRVAGRQDRRDRRRRTIHRAVSDAGPVRGSRRTAGIQAGRSQRAGSPRTSRRSAIDDGGRRRDRDDRVVARRRPSTPPARPSAPRSTARRFAICRSAAASATRSISRQASAPAAPSAVANPSIGGSQRPREPVRHRRREHHQRRLRRAGFVLDRVRLARQRHAVRLHAGSPGEDRRLRSGVRTGDRRRHQRRHQERFERAQGQRVRLRTAAQPRIAYKTVQTDRRTVQHRRVTTERCRRHGRRTGPAGTGCSSSARSIRSGRRPRSTRRRDFRSRRSATSIAIAASRNYAAKGDMAADARHRFDASFFGDPATGDNGPAAHLVAAEPDDLRLQLARVRRPQPDRPLRRRL